MDLSSQGLLGVLAFQFRLVHQGNPVYQVPLGVQFDPVDLVHLEYQFYPAVLVSHFARAFLVDRSPHTVVAVAWREAEVHHKSPSQHFLDHKP